MYVGINPLNDELNSICYLLALLAHHFLHVSRIRVKSLTLRLLMPYIHIYIYIYIYICIYDISSLRFNVKYPLFLLEINGIWRFTTDYGKIIECQIFMKIRPVGFQLFHADRQTDRQTRRSSYSRFAILRTRLKTFVPSSNIAQGLRDQ